MLGYSLLLVFESSQFGDSKDGQVYVKIKDDSGNWLALLQTASEETSGNTHVYYEGKIITDDTIDLQNCCTMVTKSMDLRGSIL